MKKLILIFAFSAYLVSCGASKNDKHETKEEIKVEAKNDVTEENKKEEAVKNDVNTNVNTKVEETAEATKITPIDPKKPMKYTDSDGKTTTTENAELNIEKKKKSETKNEKIVDKTIKTTTEQGKKADKSILKASGSKRVVDVHKEREGVIYSLFMSYWWVILIILIIAIWYFRKKIPFIKNIKI